MSNARQIPYAESTEADFSPRMQEGFASLRLEGITLSKASMDDLLEYDQGKISKQEAIDRALSRVKSRI